jgi:hypothetical protein
MNDNLTANISAVISAIDYAAVYRGNAMRELFNVKSSDQKKVEILFMNNELGLDVGGGRYMHNNTTGNAALDLSKNLNGVERRKILSLSIARRKRNR